MARNQIDVTIRAFNLAKKELDSLNKQLGGVEKVGGKADKSMQGFGKAIAGLGLAAAAKQAGQFVLEATKLSARVETLGVVTQTLGKNAGFTTTEIRQLERAIQEKGITTQASRASLAKMMQAELDLADATDLARLAQDAAVIAGTNSSEAFERLINVISTGNVRMARTMGLQVDFNAGYEKMAATLGKTTDELTAQEKAQSRTNSVMVEGSQIAGAYEDAMDSVGKQLESTARFWEEWKVAVGETNIEQLGKINKAIQENLEASTIELQARKAAREALELGLITQDEWNKSLEFAWDVSVDYADVLKEMTGKLDFYSAAREQALSFDKVSLETKLKLTAAELELTDAQKSMNEALSSGTEKELRLMQVEAIRAGDFALATSIGEQIELIRTQNFELETLIALLETLDGKTVTTSVIVGGFLENPIFAGADVGGQFGSQILRGSGLGLGAGTVQAFGQTFNNAVVRDGLLYVNGRLFSTQQVTPKAKGGVLDNGISLVGEEGAELIVDGVVIPHDESVKLMQLGLVPEQGFAEGGPTAGGSFIPMIESIFQKPRPTEGIPLPPTDFEFSPATRAQSEGRQLVPSGTSSLSAPTATAAAAASAQVASVVAAQISAGTSATVAQQDEMIEILRNLATAEDIQLAMETALEMVAL